MPLAHKATNGYGIFYSISSRDEMMWIISHHSIGGKEA